MKLNPYQRNYLWVTLRSFEEALRQTECWLEKDDDSIEEGILYQRRLWLTDQRRQIARQWIQQALQEIGDLSQALGMEPTTEDVAQTIMAQMSTCWANLADSRSNSLRRYGAVDPEVEQNLDPLLERLAQTALVLANLFKPAEKPNGNES